MSVGGDVRGADSQVRVWSFLCYDCFKREVVVLLGRTGNQRGSLGVLPQAVCPLRPDFFPDQALGGS